MQTIDVAVGFQYNSHANMQYGLIAFVMTAASVLMGYSFTFDSTMETAWTYNFFWTFLTWGMTFFVWVERMLFKSNGGLFDHLFIILVKAQLINVFFAYWAIDILILYGTIDYTPDVLGTSKTANYGKLGALFVLQCIAGGWGWLLSDSL